MSSCSTNHVTDLKTTDLNAAKPAAAGSAAAGSKPANQATNNAAALAYAQQTLSKMSLEQKIGQLFVADIWGQSADEANASNQKKYGVASAAEVIERYQVGGVIYFNNADKQNISNPTQVAKLSNGLQQAALGSGAKVPLLISTDQEGGRVTRIGAPATEYPGNMAIGADGDIADATTVGAVNGHELRAIGINQNLAPDADVNSNPLNPVIGARSFSSDPGLASKLVAAEIAGYQQSGTAAETVSAAAKHFPGHGDAAQDSHTGLPVINRTQDQWRQIDLPPFKAAIDSGVDAIMSAHISVPSLDPSGEPATLSKPILTGLLRNELHYDGLVVTDSLQMQGVRDMHSDAEIPVLAIEAGADQMLMPPNLEVAINGVLNAVHSGRISQQRIDQSVARILKLKFTRAVVSNPLVDENTVTAKVGTAENLAQIQKVADHTATVVSNTKGVLPLKDKTKILVTGWERPDYPGYPATPVTELAKQLAANAMPTGANPTADQIKKVTTAAKNANTIIVLTNGLPDSKSQQNLLKTLAATGKPVVAVAVQEPYDIAAVSAPTWVATGDWRNLTMDSLA
jgi:beta-N-acetylhexosaminidase